MVMRQSSTSTALSIFAAALALQSGGCASNTATTDPGASYSMVQQQRPQPRLSRKWVTSSDPLTSGATLVGPSSVAELTNSIGGADRTFSGVRQQGATSRIFRKQIPHLAAQQQIQTIDVWIITVTDGWLLVTGDSPYAQGSKVLAASSGTTYLVRNQLDGGVQVDRIYLNEGSNVELYKENQDGTYTSLNVSLTLDQPYVECRDGVVKDGPRKLDPANAQDAEFLALNRDARAVGRSSGLTIP